MVSTENPPKAGSSLLVLNSAGPLTDSLILFISGGSLFRFPPNPPGVFQPRQVGIFDGGPVESSCTAAPVLGGGQGRACPSFLADLPTLEVPGLPGKMAPVGEQGVCVHSSLPRGQVPSDESVGAFETVRETDFLVRSCPVQLEGQIRLSCWLPRGSKADDTGLKGLGLVCFKISTARHGESSCLSASLNSLIQPALWAWEIV